MASKITYRIWRDARGYWFQGSTVLGISHGPFTTREEAVTAAISYFEGF
ncbi:MAG: hypothetical protein ACO3FN_08995 [Vulcanococcus sp.]